MAEQVKLMNMCMLMDAAGRVLVQNRKKGNYDGLTFPGGKVEPGESLTDSVIREVQEETGLTIQDPVLCGVDNWYRKDGARYVVLFYKARKFSGRLRDSREGHMAWLTLEELKRGNAAFGMEDMLKVFLGDVPGEIWYGNSPESWERTVIQPGENPE